MKEKKEREEEEEEENTVESNYANERRAKFLTPFNLFAR